MGKLFRGHYSHTVDSKGRLILPQKFREILGGEFIITKGYEQCLYIYPMEYWDEVEENLVSLPTTDKTYRDFIRFLVGNAVEGEFDGNSRTLIPQNLREYAKITKDVVSKGMLKYIELWSKEALEEYETRAENGINPEMLDNMAKVGI